jgi:hypothetical protein
MNGFKPDDIQFDWEKNLDEVSDLSKRKTPLDFFLFGETQARYLFAFFVDRSFNRSEFDLGLG